MLLLVIPRVALKLLVLISLGRWALLVAVGAPV